ncbi:MAG TPA: metalloregulator ArsR/SmtB family transcription factor [Halanaerobiales bacterium]|nr:metalloregulator ArsR/SmtB family transcription factor [Halanaerobiales bacterium]
MNKMVKTIKALGDETRLKIIKLLLMKKFCVGALARRLDISESAVSQQLKILREADLVVGEKEGYYVHYIVKIDKLKEAGEYISNLENISQEDDPFLIKQEIKEKCRENGKNKDQ